ncbi:MAG TPA: hypothetical protein VFD64_11940 [Gemmatimonadaceae bacterium]|nr:hypothetical protein [Gemmatimonadaceae bacterium]
MLETEISDEARLYSDEEIALILREAAQSAASPAATRSPTAGLSLQQIKAAAAEAGLDPALVERAALRIPQRGSESFFARAAGGPLKFRETFDLPIAMREEVSTRLLSAVRATAEVPGKGSADASGFAWHAWFKGNPLSVTAHEDSRGTRVQILVERKGSMIRTLYFTTVAVVMTSWTLVESINTISELLAWTAIPIGAVTLARAHWKTSTRAIRERIAMLTNAVRHALPTGNVEGAPPDADDK